MQRVARDEGLEPSAVCDLVARGQLVIPCNRNRKASKIYGIGTGLATKVNANIGTSMDYPDVETELDKLRAAQDAGTHSIMDLSTGGDLPAIRRTLMEQCDVMVGTVPIYETVTNVVGKGRGIKDMEPADILNTIRRQAAEGVDFVTVHCGITHAVLDSLRAARRTCGIVSRGGTFLAEWMTFRKQENPLYERFDELLDVAREHDVTLSLGDGMRPGALADAFDSPQVHELMVLGELAERARSAGVQVMIEGPGHVPLDQVVAQVKLQKEMCKGAPFYVLGPIVTDVAPGYDHITSAIGGAVAAMAGADFLCHVTPAEHLSLPGPAQIHVGVIAARIAAHAADVAKGIKNARQWDDKLSRLRRQRDWAGMIEASIDPERARQYRAQGKPAHDDVCSMCGDFCVFKISDEVERFGY